MTPCPVCCTEIEDDKIQYEPGTRSSFFPCPLCGDFFLYKPTHSNLPDVLRQNRDASAKISHAISRMQKNSQPPFLDREAIKRILEKPLPKPSEQADLFIRWLAEKLDGPGDTIPAKPAKHKSIIGAKSDEVFSLVLEHLIEVGLVKKPSSQTLEERRIAGTVVTLSMKGWDYYENLKLGGAIYRKAFMAMKFGDLRLEKIVEDIFKPKVKQAGFDLLKLSDRPKAGLIDDRLRVEIQSSDFLVADLTHDNHGAYWEAGYEEGLGKPVIYTCAKGNWETVKTHFDTNHHLTV